VPRAKRKEEQVTPYAMPRVPSTIWPARPTRMEIKRSWVIAKE
jgi:hypothetical protein